MWNRFSSTTRSKTAKTQKSSYTKEFELNENLDLKYNTDNVEAYEVKPGTGAL